MLAFIQGKVTRISPHQVIVKQGGIGFLVQTSLLTTQRLQTGQEVTFLTVLIFPREEGEATLYGFLEEEERKYFLLLRKVPRLGPQKALAILSHFSPAHLRQIIQTGNIAALSSVKGIGKKLAQQILLELQTILKELPIQTLPPSYQEAYEALLALGFTPSEATERLQKAYSTHPEFSTEELLQYALKNP
ncbi:MAG: Holliday junction branch migration protein RuvA [Bacteroidia bacterium]|nr:Holliday junction branch migration protein RuvA [Bacteroidia bacterium]